MQKLLTFFSKNTCELDFVLTRTINILTTNELFNYALNNWALVCRKCMNGMFKDFTEFVISTAINYIVVLSLQINGPPEPHIWH